MQLVPMSSYELEDRGERGKDRKVFYMPSSVRLPHPYRGLRSHQLIITGWTPIETQRPRLIFCLYRCLDVSLTALVLGSVLGTGLGCRRWKTAAAYEIVANQHVGPD